MTFDPVSTRVRISGSAGFTGCHLARMLLAGVWAVQGCNGMTDWIDATLLPRLTGDTPATPVRAGIAEFVA